MLNFYFCGAISGGRQLAPTYKKIIKMLQLHGNVLTEHFGDNKQIRSKDRILSDSEIHDRDMAWIIDSDLLVAEVTVPSLGVGYELGRAVEMGKPILCLYNTSARHRLSAMIAGCENVEIQRYSDPDELKEVLAGFAARNTPGNKLFS